MLAYKSKHAHVQSDADASPVCMIHDRLPDARAMWDNYYNAYLRPHMPEMYALSRDVCCRTIHP
eukprot:10266518-Lingulodinium_polyedra.AAC.2